MLLVMAINQLWRYQNSLRARRAEYCTQRVVFSARRKQSICMSSSRKLSRNELHATAIYVRHISMSCTIAGNICFVV